MRAVQRHTEKPESQQPDGDTQPVQRHESLRGVDFATAVQRLAPLQQKEDTANVHAAAQRGTSGGGGSLPYLGQIQKSFGSHDVSGIKSHTGGKASEACESMGAEAYASGQDVAFKGQPDLHTAAHEAAHIVQQKAGVQLSGGVGKAGDPYEKNADEVADRVVQGKSAEDLLGGPTFGGAAAVQRSVQMKGGLLDKLKAFFLEAKLTGPQQQVAKILAEKHGVDVSGLPTSTFASLYNDAGGNNPKQSPDKTAANMASAARDHVGEKKPTQKKESGVVSGVSIQRKETRHVQRVGGVQMAPGAAHKNPYVLVSWHMQKQLAENPAAIGGMKKKNEEFARLWLSTAKAKDAMEKQIAVLRADIVKSFYVEASLVTLNGWCQSFDEIVKLRDVAKNIAGIDVKKVASDFLKLKAAGQGALKNAGVDPKKLEKSIKAGQKHYQATKGTYDQVKGQGETLGGTMSDLSEILKNPTKAPTEEEAIADLIAFRESLDPQALLKDKEKVVGKLTAAGLQAYQGILKFTVARGVKVTDARRNAAQTALGAIEQAHIHALKVHRAVNHGYWSLTNAIQRIDKAYRPPHQIKK
ncbi:MAG TPA: DUF4157 domain-containing protein [Myxococcota bacterium]|nr:DUF4157 domain-containing protein [Myxococcota bacterium]